MSKIVKEVIETVSPAEPTLSLRDRFAIAAMSATCNDNDWISADYMAEWCYKQADAMLKARG